MHPLLFDQGLPRVAPALSSLGLNAHEVGGAGAPPSGGPDHDNCRWCRTHEAILVTHDRGRRDKAILDALAEYRVHAIFVHSDLRAGPPHCLARALLVAEPQIDALVAGRHLIRHRLRVKGGLDKR
jgi:hypothetical protein